MQELDEQMLGRRQGAKPLAERRRNTAVAADQTDVGVDDVDAKR